MTEKMPDTVDLHYVRDRNGLIWRVVRDGGMVATVDYSGQHYSAGLAWLEQEHGPLVNMDPPSSIIEQTLMRLRRSLEELERDGARTVEAQIAVRAAIPREIVIHVGKVEE